MPNVRSLRNSEPYKAILKVVTCALRENRAQTEEELEYKKQVSTWLAESADVYRRAQKLAQEVGAEAAEQLLREHNVKKPRRPKGAKRTTPLPRTAEVEAVVVYELAMLALKQLATKDAARKQLVDTALQHLQRG